MPKNPHEANDSQEVSRILESTILNKYPFINAREGLTRYQQGKSTYASFDPTQADILPFILGTAILRDTDTQDPAFCRRIVKHRGFQATADKLLESIQERVYTTQIQEFTTRTTEDKYRRKRHQLSITGKQDIRTSYRPVPYQFTAEANMFMQEENIPDNQKNSHIKRYLETAAGQFGIPFVILSGIYASLPAEEVLSLFEKSEVIEQIRDKRREAVAIGIKIPTPDEYVPFSRLYTSLTNLIMDTRGYKPIPFFSSKAYNKAIASFPPEYSSDIDKFVSDYHPVVEQIHPFAIFAGLDDIAYKIVRPTQTEQLSSQSIEQMYGQRMTTQMVTQFDKTSVFRENRLFNAIIK